MCVRGRGTVDAYAWTVAFDSSLFDLDSVQVLD